MIKFNWGTKLAIIIVVFILGILFLVFRTTMERIDLVTEDYYPKELEYQKDIDKLSNVSSLQENVKILLESKRLNIQFPSVFKPQEIEGRIYFYRPSDKNLDQNYSIQLNDSLQQTFPKNQFVKGKYHLIIDWEYHDKPYLYKQEIYIY